ncbi:MAG TPA: hypothetical protein VNG13_10360 [Mycobacteriales bacterium]|nr:hypothetical protein [Mycobacteriales bacterium]
MIFVVTLLVGATACTSQRAQLPPLHPSTSPPVTRGASLGTLVGQVKYYGGPEMFPSAGGGTPHMALEGAPGRGVLVIVSSGGLRVASMATGQDGRFQFELESGRYLLSTAASDGCPESSVLVRAGIRTQHYVICNVP